MATEVKLSPGWLLQDVRLAAARLAPTERQLQEKTPVSRRRLDADDRPQTNVIGTQSTQPESGGQDR